MYSQQDVDDAVASGALSAESAAALRSHVERQRMTPSVDEEQFRLITGFNDIFVSIAAAILLFAVGWIGQSIGQAIGFVVDGNGPSPLAPALVAATAWALALFFTARRRMALPSILLLLAFAGGVLAASGFLLVTGVVAAMGPDPFDSGDERLATAVFGIVGALAAAITVTAAWLHWRRFRVPITIAAGAAAAAAVAVGLLIAAIGPVESIDRLVLGFVLALGIGVFLFAMRWDASDPQRVTRRSDVAFWLHLLAAPMIVHPVFTLLGLNDGSASIGEGLVVIALYIALGLTALAIDRRALLVSALAYVLFALNRLFETFGAVELNVALTALVIGSALLLLSAFWHQARAAVVTKLPGGLQSKLPTLGASLAPQPVAA
jgi:MFS family permease